MSTLRTLSRRIILALSAAVLVIAPTIIAAPQAQAAPPADINVNAKGSITIHKYENPAWAGTTANGQVLNAPASAKPVQGVTFRIRKISSIDVTRESDWKRLTDNTVPTFNSQANGAEFTQVTDSTGTATFSNLPVGAYYVTETNKPANVQAKVPDFIVTIPHPSQGQGGTSSWVYDVHVYPKNTVNPNPVKTMDESKAFIAGDEVKWTIEQIIPDSSADDPLQAVTIGDTLPYGINYKSAQLYVNGAPITAAINHNGGRVNVVVPNSVAGFAPGNTIRLEIVTTASIGGRLTNTADSDFRTKYNANRVFSNGVSTSWAHIDVQKVTAETGSTLQGAQFELYTDAACSPEHKVAVDQGKLRTESDGNFPAPLLVKQGTYYLKESNPPSGYLFPANNCMKIEPTAAANAETNRAAILRVENIRAAAPPLPATGANGELLLAIGGGVVILTGLGIVFVALRRRAKN